MFKYDDVITALTQNFTDMKKKFEEDEDYYEDLPYVFYESEFVPYIVENANMGNNDILINVFEFVEDLLKNGDEKVVNLVEVAVVESLFLEKGITNKDVLLSYFGDLTMKSYKECLS